MQSVYRIKIPLTYLFKSVIQIDCLLAFCYFLFYCISINLHYINVHSLQTLGSLKFAFFSWTLLYIIQSSRCFHCSRYKKQLLYLYKSAILIGHNLLFWLVTICYSDWSQWSCVTRGKGEQQQRARTCTGCIGDISQLRDRVRE